VSTIGANNFALYEGLNWEANWVQYGDIIPNDVIVEANFYIQPWGVSGY